MAGELVSFIENVTRKQNIEPINIKDKLCTMIDNENINLLESKIPRGFGVKAAKQLGVEPKVVYQMVYRIRKETRPVRNVSKEEAITTIDPFRQMLLDSNLIRSAPAKEKDGCDKIVDLLEKLPKGGFGLLIGTPTAICAAETPANKMIIMDNFVVAFTLMRTTSYQPSIIIGTSVDRKKAELKAAFWKSNNITCHCDIRLDAVDKMTYTHYLTKFVEKYDFVKVVLMTSGMWSCTQETSSKYNNIDGNFEAPSLYLSEKYDNLHIIPMVMNYHGQSGTFGFDVLHVNKGEVKII